MIITKLMFVETGTFNPMVHRPYQTNVDGDTVERFGEATNWGSTFNQNVIAGAVGDLVRPTAQAHGLVSIENNWDTRRLRFIMEVQHDEAMGATRTQVLCGYTNHVGATVSGAIDPNMRLFFNSSITLRHVTEQTPMGMVTRSNIADSSQLINPIALPYGENKFTMRPEDVFTNMQLAVFNSEGDEVVDYRSHLSDGIKKSRRSNNNATGYLSKTLQAYSSARNDGEYYSDTADLYEDARGTVQEALISNDSFMRRAMAETHLRQDGSALYSELLSMDPMLEQRVIVHLLSEPQRQRTNYGHSTAHWTSADQETVTATILAHSVPSLMLDLMLTKATITMTNNTIGGEYDVRVLGGQGFNENIDLSPYMYRLVERLKLEVLNDLTRNNNVTVDISMAVDIVGDSLIKISLNGQPPVDYAMPSFCDALSIPVVTNSAGNLTSLASDIDMLVTSIAEPQHFNQGAASNGFNSLI